LLSHPHRASFPEAVRYLGFATVTPSSFNPDHDPDGAQIQSLFQNLRGALDAAGLLYHELVGISFPADELLPPQHIHYVAALAHDNAVIDGMTEVIVPAGDYFVATYQGPLITFDAAVNDFYMTLVPASGYAPRDGYHLEKYPSTWRGRPTDTMQLMLPIAAELITGGNDAAPQ